MEHLFYDAISPQETVAACKEPILKTNWDSYDDLLDFVPPQTPWYQFNHDDMPLSTFDDYPKVAGYNVTKLWNADFVAAHSSFTSQPASEMVNRTASLLQSWLYYGLLESVVQKKIKVSYLMRQDRDGQNYLYSRNLHFCMQMRVFSIRTAGPNSKAQINMTIELNLRHVNRWLNRFMSWGHPSFRPRIEVDYPGLMDLIEETVPAIVRLGEAIEQMRLFVLRELPTIGGVTWKLPLNVLNRNKLQLKVRGWCDFQVALLEHTIKQSTIDWIIATDMRQDPNGHENCEANACGRNNIDELTYRQEHVHQDCKCTKLIPDIQQVEKILLADEIPVMFLDTSSEPPELNVRSRSRAVAGDYIAISHVWVDGLGGASEHGLNQCQVECLSDLANRAGQPATITPFWIDSLCIPRTSKEVYFKALVGIRDVYLNSTRVLVVDKTIKQCKMSSTSEELYAHIYLSAWMQRMWTYEEAVLAKELVFVLKDGLHTYSIKTEPYMRRTICVVFQSLSAELYRLRVKPGRLNIGHIQQAFRYRLTNAKQEEFLSVSGMLNLHTKELLELRGDARTKQFWLLLKDVPFNIPFLDCPKLSHPGFRWAPKTMMYPSQTRTDTAIDGRKSICTEQGLVGNYLTISLNTALHGSACQSDSIFYVWVTGCDQSLDVGGDQRAVLRLYCTEGWPIPPDTWTFDTIILPHEDYRIPGMGQWVTGLALHSEDAVTNGSEDFCPILKYRYVEKLLIERLQNGELASEQSTIMFPGHERIEIDTRAIWSKRDVCIT